MKKSYYLLLILLISSIYSYSQSTVPITLNGFEVLPQYLQNGKILINRDEATTTIEYKLMYSRNSGSSFISSQLATVNAAGNGTTSLSPIVTVTSADFPSNTYIITKTYTATINKSLLTQGRKIILYYLGGQTFNEAAIWSNRDYDFVIPPAPPVPLPVTINSVFKTETILFGTDCGLNHANGVSYNQNGHMENNVWKFAYDINFTKNNSNLQDSDIFWEWVVSDFSNFPTTEKQFLVYPYGTDKTVVLNGEKKVTVEANDYLDEYDSVVKVRAKSRSTGAILSSDFIFYFTAVNH